MGRKHIATEEHLFKDDLGPAGHLEQPVTLSRRSIVRRKREIVASSKPEDVARWEQVGEALVGFESRAKGREL